MFPEGFGFWEAPIKSPVDAGGGLDWSFKADNRRRQRIPSLRHSCRFSVVGGQQDGCRFGSRFAVTENWKVTLG
jgi:hypothetical protein